MWSITETQQIIVKIRNELVISNGDLQLQVTGWDGAEGKDQRVLANWDEVKSVLMGSLAGPESPRPCSHKMKLREAIDFESMVAWEGEERSIVKMVMEKVNARIATGFNAEEGFIFLVGSSLGLVALFTIIYFIFEVRSSKKLGMS